MDSLQLAADDLPDTSGIESAFDKAAEWVRQNKGFTVDMLKDAPIRALIDETVGFLSKGIAKGVVETAPSSAMVTSLKESVGVFSGFKTFHEMKEAAAMLTDKTGQIKPFNQFANEVQTINKTYNHHYLKAEYEFTVASSEMAARWEELSEDEDRYNLQYRTVGDEKVRKEHRELDGITLPASDPFWNSYYPPNGWRCRCTVVKVRKSKYAQSDSQEAIGKGNDATAGRHQEMFRFNPGKQRAAYPAYNSYTIGKCSTCSKDGFKLARIPNNELCQACRVIREMRKVKGELSQQRKAVASWAKENLVGKTVLIAKIINPVEFTMNGIKEAINKPHKRIIAKNEALRNIVDLLKEGSYVMERTEDKGNPMVNKYHYVKIKIAGEASYAVIRELIDGRMQFYAIVERLKGKE